MVVDSRQEESETVRSISHLQHCNVFLLVDTDHFGLVLVTI